MKLLKNKEDDALIYLGNYNYCKQSLMKQAIETFMKKYPNGKVFKIGAKDIKPKVESPWLKDFRDEI